VEVMTYLQQMSIWTRIAYLYIQDSEECLHGVDKGIVWRCLAYFFFSVMVSILLYAFFAQVFDISEVTINDDIVKASIL
jgi:hypothetical protein